MHGHPYRLMADFFDPVAGDRWRNPDHRAHKMFIVLGYLDRVQSSISVRLDSETKRNTTASFNNA